ncbi:MAG TPA: methyltransferase domain-containing protein [Burkholderiaceae bacterium]|nr:methyltransferase domain-containing protein [Burkholderiaceae bacterium]
MPGPTVEFWQQRFESRDIPWDRGSASPRLVHLLESGRLASEPARPCRILVPGCGSGHEVELLARSGFRVVAIDYAPAAVEQTRQRLQRLMQSPDGARLVSAEVVQADVLAWSAPAPFDAVYEQTCLCALHPDHWIAYASQLRAWLRPGGVLHALFMQALRPQAAPGELLGPPYHCDLTAMRALFASSHWQWPAPPYPTVPHPIGHHEIAVELARR